MAKVRVLTTSNYHTLKVGDRLRFVHMYWTGDPTNRYMRIWTNVRVSELLSEGLSKRKFHFKWIEDGGCLKKSMWNVDSGPNNCWEWVVYGEVEWFKIWTPKPKKKDDS